MARYAARVVGADKSDNRLARARAMRDQQNASYELLDCFDVSALLKLGPFTKIFIDISGSRDVGTLVELMHKYEVVFRPKTLVVKSFKMKRLHGMSTVFDCRHHGQGAGTKDASCLAGRSPADGPADGPAAQRCAARHVSGSGFAWAVWAAFCLPIVAAGLSS